MKVVSLVLLFTCAFLSTLQGSPVLDRARQLEKSGDALEARALLAHAVQNAPQDIVALTEYAEFLDRYGDPGAKEAYGKLLAVLEAGGDTQPRALVARRLAELSLLEGDRSGAARFLATPPAWRSEDAGQNRPYLQIPGPLHSFRRMAAISKFARPEGILPALARNVVTNGYQASRNNETLEPTEYLKLLHRYLSQAHEMEKLAGAGQVIHIPTCDAPETGELLRILGFRMRGGCGSELVLETVNATRAFLTTDSGFPLARLEEALRTNRPFSYDYHPMRVPLLFSADYWLSPKERGIGDFIDAFISDPALCRLYLGMSKLDRETAETLRQNIPLARLKAYAHVLDFFGGMFEIRNGKAMVPGAPRTTGVWGELAGAPPDQGAVFFEKLISHDDGWLASYFDALARINGPVKEYLTDPARLKRFYLAVRGKVTTPGPARPVFRANADMLLLTTRLWLDPDGRPHVPGNLDVWKDLFVSHPHGKYDAKLARAAAAWKAPDDVLEALFGLTRKSVENEPLKVFMALSDLDRYRPTRLSAATAGRLAREYRQYGSQYSIFNDAVPLSEKSINEFLDTAGEISRMRDTMLRADTAGTMQALVGLWQIFSRSGSLPASQADETFGSIVQPFSAIHNDRALFDAGRNGVRLLLAATGSSNTGERPQERLIDLLAGAAHPSDADSHRQIVEQMVRILEAQRIVSLDDMLELADHLESGGQPNSALMDRLAARISEVQLPRATLSAVEKNVLAIGYWTDKHIESERRLNLRAAVDRASGEKLKEVRGLLAPLLRDTLVAYNYAHYAPPGAQVLFTNPVFVRSHDFVGMPGVSATWRTTDVFGTGWPSNGGGRLVGSMAGLPYALAEAEQNFLVPQQTQALIWGDLVPQMIESAVIPRWWKVTPSQMHWVALHLRYGESLLAEAALNPKTREAVLEILSRQAAPARLARVERLLESGDVKAAVDRVTPSELFVLARHMAARPPAAPSPLLAEIQRLAKESPDEENYRAISAAFGTPKPTLANSYRPELLSLRMFPALMGYSSRILAESWESNTLYWAELADQTYLTPSQLNIRIPEWTENMVEHIFASDLEDWPAVLRSLRMVGAGVRAKAREQLVAQQQAAAQ
jgi:hypothetical protein